MQLFLWEVCDECKPLRHGVTSVGKVVERLHRERGEEGRGGEGRRSDRVRGVRERERGREGGAIFS